MKKRRGWIYVIIGAVAVGIYLFLLFLMVHAEVPNPDSSINSLWDAFWYSLVTLTTVGYGDVAPVTTAGRVVGIVFLIFSLGVLVALVSTLVSFLTSEGFPLMKLSFQKKKNWYYFADHGLEADALAKQILKTDPDSIIIYGKGKEAVKSKPDYPCQFINVTPERIARRKKDVGSRCKVFLMQENDIGVNPRAVDIALLPVDVYARTESGEDSLSGNIHFFNSYDCCAREYWRYKPLTSKESQVVIIGFGRYGQAILERAIMTNVIGPEHRVSYHIFGDARNFLNVHNHLDVAFSLQEESPDRDALIFHEGSWMEDHALIEQADRIIVCDDDEFLGWDILWSLRGFYAIRGRIDLRSNRKIPGLSYFGTNESIYSPQHILRTALNAVAIEMNNLYVEENPGALSWDELPDYLRQSRISASEHLFLKVRILVGDESITRFTPEILEKAYQAYEANKKDPALLDRYRDIEHQRWLRFYAYYNWTWGEAFDQRLRRDPRMLPYDELPEELKSHGDHAWELLGRLRLRYEEEMEES